MKGGVMAGSSGENSRTAPAFLVGSAAWETIAAAGRLRVAAVFEHSFYAECDRGGMICFLGTEREPGPLHVLCESFPGDARGPIRVGDPAVRSGGVLAFPGFAVDFSRGCVWRPPRHPLLPDSLIARGVDSLLASLPGFVPASTHFGRRLFGADAAWNGARGALAAEIDRGVALLEEELAAAEGDFSRPAAALLGLGEGLTPSGDDILGGALLALGALGRRVAADRLFGAIAPNLAAKTNRISAEHLRAAGRGEGAAPFHDVMSAVFGDAAPVASLERVGRYGHASGWDTLLGMMSVMRTKRRGAARRRCFAVG